VARFSSLTIVLVIAAAAVLAAQKDLTRAEGDRMAQKLAAIEARGKLTLPANRTPLSTSFTDREVNAYFRFTGKDTLPEGVLNPQVTIQTGSRIDAQAVVDLDTVGKSSQSWVAGVMLHGSVEVRVSGTLTVSSGKGTLSNLSATIGGVPVPVSILQEVVSQYSKTPEMPNGFQLDKPFDMPANIRDVRLQQGAATIIQ
jgi:hypothetical protein